MQLYRITDAAQGDEARIDWAGTQIDAQTAAKAMPDHIRPDVRVELVDVLTDKDSLLALIKGQCKVTVLRSWKLTTRGALADCAIGE